MDGLRFFSISVLKAILFLLTPEDTSAGHGQTADDRYRLPIFWGPIKWGLWMVLATLVALMINDL